VSYPTPNSASPALTLTRSRAATTAGSSGPCPSAGDGGAFVTSTPGQTLRAAGRFHPAVRQICSPVPDESCHHGGVEIDPLLKKLRIQSDRDEASVPLTLYLPSGRVSGRLTHSDDFYRTSEVQLQQLSEVRSVFALDDDRRV
jgi:hypothetical protein